MRHVSKALSSLVSDGTSHCATGVGLKSPGSATHLFSVGLTLDAVPVCGLGDVFGGQWC